MAGEVQLINAIRKGTIPANLVMKIAKHRKYNICSIIESCLADQFLLGVELHSLSWTKRALIF